MLQIFSRFRHLSEPISGAYSIIPSDQISEAQRLFEDAWKNPALPSKQLDITEKQLSNIEQTTPFQALINLMHKIKIPQHAPILEIGCSTGYYSEVLQRSGFNINYEGCDYSKAFIEAARSRYPNIQFQVEDATALHYPDRAFDLVISGCCLLHIFNYPTAITEAARVTKEYVIFHRTPIIHERVTTYCKKIGYGIPMVEIIFNENELVDLFEKNKLIICSVHTHASRRMKGISEPIFMKSYLCKKC